MNKEKMKSENEVIQKSGTIESQVITDEALSKINKYSLKQLTKDEIFIFKLKICDNEVDRDNEVFPLSTLKGLQNKFIGKPIIKDHYRSADNQVARIYDTELKEEDSITQTGEKYAGLIAYCYMLRTESNKDLVSEIEAGIKKEVSVGVSVKSVVCSICGTDNRVKVCEHYWGKKYDGKVCYFKLLGANDAYEVSFVPVPAQPKAGTVKNYLLNSEKKIEEKDSTTILTEDKNKETSNQISVNLKKIGLFLFEENLKKERGKKYE